MATVDFKPNMRGIGELLKLPAVEADLRRRAQNVKSNASGMSRSGESTYRVDSGIGRRRARAAVITDSVAADIAERRYHRLARAINAAR